MRKRWRCRSCQAVHHAYFGGQCRRCKRPGMLRAIEAGSTLEAIAEAVSDESVLMNSSKQKQLDLFEEPIA